MSARPNFLRPAPLEQSNSGQHIDTSLHRPTMIGEPVSDSELDDLEADEAVFAQPSRIPTRRSLLSRCWRAIRAGWLRWQISATEQYLRDCERDGIVDSLSIREFRLCIEEMRVELALLES